jgi:hypothetical protein
MDSLRRMLDVQYSSLGMSHNGGRLDMLLNTIHVGSKSNAKPSHSKGAVCQTRGDSCAPLIAHGWQSIHKLKCIGQDFVGGQRRMSHLLTMLG